MEKRAHFQRLERMYRSGAIHQHFPDFEFHLEEGKCTITTTVDESYHHAAGGMHGLIYFKLLDDAGYFAASTLEKERFLLTGKLDLQLLRPVENGILKAEGEFISRKEKVYISRAALYHNDRLVAKANLELHIGPTLLDSIDSYSKD